MPARAKSLQSRVLIPVGVATGLSLLGDSSLYAVLPTRFGDAGVALASVGILLAINRIVRVFLNPWVGRAYDRCSRRRLFVPALFLGSVSTSIYGLTQGFWPLLAGRLLWGIAWSGIWVGGNAIILDVAGKSERGTLVGRYQIAFYLGAAGGALLGGVLTDWLGYRTAMLLESALGLLGALNALLFLPETRPAGQSDPGGEPAPESGRVKKAARQSELVAASGLLATNRLVIPGILSSTFGLYLLRYAGETVTLFGKGVGVATATGLGMGAATFLAMAAAPTAGYLSDRSGGRWRAVAAGLTPGILGFGLLALGRLRLVPVALFFTALTSGSNQSIAISFMGDIGREDRLGRRIGEMHAVGDLAGAVGPPLAYAIIPWIGLPGVYLLSASLFGLMLAVAIRLAIRARQA